MAEAVFGILGQSGGDPALSRERTLANLAAVFAVRNGDLGLRTTKTRIADRNIAAMAMMIARDSPDSPNDVMAASEARSFKRTCRRTGLPAGFDGTYRTALGLTRQSLPQ